MSRVAGSLFLLTLVSLFLTVAGNWDLRLFVAGTILLACSVVGQFFQWKRLERLALERAIAAYVQRH